jgi:phosphate transport system substrate-binding protein
MRSIVSSLFILCLILAGCNTQPERSGTEVLSHQNKITISGAYALAPLVQIWVDEFKKTHPDIQFTINPNGSDQGISDVLHGVVDVGMVSSDIPRGLDTNFTIVPVSRLGVVPIISTKNPYINEIFQKGISREELTRLFTNDNPKTWGDMFGKPSKDPVNVYIRADSSGAAKIFCRYLWVEPGELKGKAIKGETNLVDAVASDPFALGFCNFIYTIDPATKQFSYTIHVLPVDFNQNGMIDGKEKIFDNAAQLQRAMWLGKFPCSLIRNLYLVTRGKPHTYEVAEFLHWVITDGQKIVAENGYIELYSSEIQLLQKALKPAEK